MKDAPGRPDFFTRIQRLGEFFGKSALNQTRRIISSVEEAGLAGLEILPENLEDAILERGLGRTEEQSEQNILDLRRKADESDASLIPQFRGEGTAKFVGKVAPEVAATAAGGGVGGTAGRVLFAGLSAAGVAGASRDESVVGAIADASNIDFLDNLADNKGARIAMEALVAGGLENVIRFGVRSLRSNPNIFVRDPQKVAKLQADAAAGNRIAKSFLAGLDDEISKATKSRRKTGAARFLTEGLSPAGKSNVDDLFGTNIRGLSEEGFRQAVSNAKGRTINQLKAEGQNDVAQSFSRQLDDVFGRDFENIPIQRGKAEAVDVGTKRAALKQRRVVRSQMRRFIDDANTRSEQNLRNIAEGKVNEDIGGQMAKLRTETLMTYDRILGLPEGTAEKAGRFSGRFRRGGESRLPRSVESFFHKLDHTYRQTFDKDFFLRKFGNEVEATPSNHPNVLLSLKNGHQALGSQIRRFGVVDPGDLERHSRGFDEILEEVSDPNLLEEYLAALRLKAGGVSGPLRDEVDAVIRLGQEDESIIRASHDLAQFNRELLKFLQRNDVITEDDLTRILSAKGVRDDKLGINNIYLPFFRDEKTALENIPGVSKREAKALKRRLPTNTEIENFNVHSPLESMIQQIYTYAELVSRRRYLNSIQDAVARNADNGYFEDVTSKIDELKLKSNNKSGSLKGVLPEELVADVDDFSKAELRSLIETFSDAEGQAYIKIREKGGSGFKVYKTNKEIASALQVLSPNKLNLFTKWFMVAPARTLRAGVTFNPAFFAKNLIRDTEFMMLSADTSIPGIRESTGKAKSIEELTEVATGVADNLLLVAKNAFKKEEDDIIKLWETSGGAFSEIISMDRAEIRQAFELLSPEKASMKQLRYYTNGFNRVLENMNKLSTISEKAPRLAEFRRVYDSARIRGMDHADAAALAAARSREVTVDFARTGAFFQSGARAEVYRLASGFFNAQLQGTARTMRLFTGSPEQRKAAIKTGMATMTLPSVLNYMHNRGHTSYYDRPDYERTLYELVRIPFLDPKSIPDHLIADSETGLSGMKKNLLKMFAVEPDGQGGHDIYLRIPVAHELGFIFQALPRRMLEAADPTNPFRDLDKTFVDESLAEGAEAIGEFLPGLISNASTTTGGILLTQLTGKNPLSGVPITNQLEEAQGASIGTTGQNADPISIGASSALEPLINPIFDQTRLPGINPRRFQQASREMFGTSFADLQIASEQLHDRVVRKIPLRLTELPVLRAFFTKADSPTRSFLEFEERHSELERKIKDFKNERDAKRNPRIGSAPSDAELLNMIHSKKPTMLDELEFDVLDDIADHTKELNQWVYKWLEPAAAVSDRTGLNENQFTIQQIVNGQHVPDDISLTEAKEEWLGVVLKQRQRAFQIAAFNRAARSDMLEKLGPEGTNELSEDEIRWIDRLNTVEEWRSLEKKDRKLYEREVLPFIKRTVEIRRVIDGDTVELDNGAKVRIANAYMPEAASTEGAAATETLRAMIKDKSVRLDLQEGQTRDEHGRLLADLKLGGLFGFGAESAGEALTNEFGIAGQGSNRALKLGTEN